MNSLKVVLAASLSCFACLAPGQDPAPKLNIVIIEGEGAVNNIRQRTVREPIVQIEDENHKPVAGVAVVFTLPTHGATGVFTNGSRVLTVFSDSKGQAVARGLKLNKVAGQMQIRVTASSQGQTANTTITQTSALGAAGAAGAAAGAGISGKVIAIIVVAAVAAAGGTVAAVKLGGGGGNTSSPGAVTIVPPAVKPPTVITPGTGTVGGPR